MKWYHGALVALTSLSSLAAPAAAQDQARDAAPSAAQATTDPFGTAGVLDEAALGKVTGREDVGLMVARSTQRNTVANNSVSGSSVTGNVQIDGNAFQNLQGLAVISANSGNNVAMNSSMNVTINMAPR